MKPKTYAYDIVRKFLIMNKNDFYRKCEISELTGLNYVTVHNVILKAWKLGWVVRNEIPVHDRAFQGVPCYKTQYKIKRTESWMGMTPLYHQIMQNEKKNRKN